MFKRKIFFFAIIITVVFLFAGCKTLQPETDNEAEKDAIPEWFSSQPADSEYFMGIGFSNTGNEADDLSNAKKKAFSDLISVILKHIKNSQYALLPADAEKKYFGAAEAHISQSLTMNAADLKSDSFYSEKNGGWFYYKILKADWERIEKEEKQEILQFLNDLLAPKLSSKESTDYDILSSFGSGWKFLAESPYPEAIYGSLGSGKGIYIDLIEDNIAKVFSRLVINIKPDNLITEPGRSENMTVSITDKEGRKPGEFKIEFFNKTDRKKISEIVTKKDGTYSGNIELFKNLPLGKHQLYAEISMPYMETNQKLFKKNISAPAKEFTITVNKISVVLKLVVNGEAEIEDFIDQTKALFTKKELEIKLSPGTRNEIYTILFTINFRNHPKNSHNLFITDADATVVLVKDGKNIFSYKTNGYREVGLSWNLAQERVAVKMFDDIDNDNLFFKELHKALYAETIFE